MFAFPDVSNLRRFPIPEGRHLELKQSCSAIHDEKILQTICAFLNSGGGYVVIGVRDDLDIVGVLPNKNLDRFLRTVDDIYHLGVIFPTPPIGYITCAMHKVPTGEICVVSVRPDEREAPAPPYQMKDGTIMHRLMASNLRLSAGLGAIYTDRDIESARQSERDRQKGVQQKMAADYATLVGAAKNMESRVAVMEANMKAMQEMLFAEILQRKEAAEADTQRASWWSCLW